MAQVDPSFIQPIEHRPNNLYSTEDDGIPVVDLSPLDHHDDDHSTVLPDDVARVVAQVGEACEKWGFFQVINHGIPVEKLEKAGRKFFDLPLEEKKRVSRDEGNHLGYYDAEHTKNVRDWKEVFDFVGRGYSVTPVTPDDLQPKKLFNRWPQYPPQLREIGEEYAKEMEKLGLKLMEVIALSLGLPATTFTELFKDHPSGVRLSHYPPCPSPELALGIGPHKDTGALTILAQDNVGGLEVRRKSDGQWVKVKPIPGAFIINVGDIVQVWTNGKYESPEHRVKLNSEKDRLSIIFFFSPGHYVWVKPLEELIDDQNPAKYKPYNWGEFFATRRKSNLKKLAVANIQISEFQINP